MCVKGQYKVVVLMEEMREHEWKCVVEKLIEKDRRMEKL